MEDEIVGMIHDDWVTITTVIVGYLGVNYRDWELCSMCVDCKLLEDNTMGKELTLKIPRSYRKQEVTGVLIGWSVLGHPFRISVLCVVVCVV